MSDETGVIVGRAPTVEEQYGRDLPLSAPVQWLKAGVADTMTSPVSSLAYGLAVFSISVAFIAALYQFDISYVLLPSIAGFMVIGPMMAVGLYGKSRLIEAGARRVSISEMMMVRAQSPWQILFVGVFLLLVMLFWLRTAILLYALFYGLHPFVGLTETIDTLFFTPRGNTLLLVGTGIGAVLAAFSFSISAFSIPMLMHERKDTIIGMVISLVIAWTNKPVVLVWGAMVLGLFLLCVATGFIGLIVIFPILGHATWHAYRAMRRQEAVDEAQPIEQPN